MTTSILLGVLLAAHSAFAEPRTSAPSGLTEDQALLLRARTSLELYDLRDSAFKRAKEEGRVPLALTRAAEADLPTIRTNTLIVVHASFSYDHFATARAGVNQVIANFKAAKQPVIFLVDDDKKRDFTWYTDDRSPQLSISSRGGEHPLKTESGLITIVGGRIGLCLTRALAQITRGYIGSKALRIEIPLRAAYEHESFFPQNRLNAFDEFSSRPREEYLKAITRKLLFAPGNDGPDDPQNFEVDLSRYTVEVRLDGTRIATRGEGKVPLEINLKTQ